MLNLLRKLTKTIEGFFESVMSLIRQSSKATYTYTPKTEEVQKFPDVATAIPTEIAVVNEPEDAVDESSDMACVVTGTVEESNIADSNKKIGNIQMFKDKRGKWRWRFIVNNGNIIATSSESYHNFEDAERAIHIVFETNANTVDVEVIKD